MTWFSGFEPEGSNGGADGTRTIEINAHWFAFNALSLSALILGLSRAQARHLSRDWDLRPMLSREISGVGVAWVSGFEPEGSNGGADGTRTRDLSRDRRAF